MDGIQFHPRWREELVASSNEGTLIFEFTMGTYHVYFPEEKLWEANVPEWAKGKWKLYADACSEWCQQSKIPISFVSNTFLYEEKKPG